MDWRGQLQRSSFFAICCIWGVLIISPPLWLLIGAMVEWGVSGQSTAAWVQAIGSVGAILVAIHIASAQQGREQAEIKRHSHELDVGRATRLFFAVKQVSFSVDDLVRQLKEVTELPENVSLGFASTFDRFNRNFDDDLSLERIEIATGIRHDLGIVVRVLSDPIQSPEYLRRKMGDMSEQFQRYLSQTEAHLESVSGLANQVQS